MDLSSIVRNNSEYNKKYEYYTSLGYSEKAALVLSVFTYGGVELKKLIEDLGNDRILERLYDWVLESNGKDPMSEVRSYYAESTGPPSWKTPLWAAVPATVREVF